MLPALPDACGNVDILVIAVSSLVAGGVIYVKGVAIQEYKPSSRQATHTSSQIVVDTLSILRTHKEFPTAMASATQLSFNDNAVLGALFDPESSLSNSTQVDDSLPSDVDIKQLQHIQERERRALLPLNEESPAPKTVQNTIAELDGIISEHPKYASAYNNRAQTRRMLYAIEDLHRQIEQLRLILNDLAHAIQLATPANPLEPVPVLNAKVLASAHTHRGYLLYSASKSEELANAVTSATDNLRSLDRDGLEEMASREFGLGGRYGNDTARQLAVRTNPYAKLCGSIVKEAMQKEVSDYHMRSQGIAPSVEV